MLNINVQNFDLESQLLFQIFFQIFNFHKIQNYNFYIFQKKTKMRIQIITRTCKFYE